MKAYLLLIKGSFEKWNALTEARRTEVVREFSTFAEKLGQQGYMRGGDGCGERSFRLFDPQMSKAESLLSPDTTDMVTGYFLIEVPDEDDALEVARQCPAFGCGEYVELVPCGH